MTQDKGNAMQIQAFDFNSHNIRVIEQDGQPWFVLGDVCAVLGIVNVRNVARRLDADQVQTVRLADGIQRGNPNKHIVSESGLWDTLMRSDSKKARPFQRWLTSEVLPAIRQTGSYTVPSTTPALPAPDMAGMFQQLALTVLQPLAAQTVQTIEAKVAEAKAEVREEMTSIAHQMDAKIGSLPVTSVQIRNVKDLVNAIVARRKELGFANWHWGKVYNETWHACGVGNLAAMTRSQYPKVVEYLTAELTALRVMSPNSGLFREPQAAPA